MTSTERRLNSVRSLLTHLRERLGLSLGFVLWDGSTVPDGLACDAFAIAIADEGAIAALIRRPKLDTALNLVVSGRFDLRNGTIFDLMAQRPRVRIKDFLKTLDKRLLLKAAAQFLLVPRGGPWPLEDIRGDKARRDGSEETNRENVHYHYDLSNDFYALFLDPEMVYTCAHFTEPHNDIARAQRDKLDMICRKLRLKPDETLLDIGCGWGSLLIHAARNYGARGHGVTLAKEQFTYANEKIAKLGLQDRITIEFKDYSLLDGAFDKIASIGMFEQVGSDNYELYFKTVHRLLKPQGLYLHHAIGLPARGRTDREFLRRQSEWGRLVGRYIFPGGELDHLGMSIANLERYGFEVHDVEAWREHYVRTTRLWHDRLRANFSAAEREVGAAKTRLWLIYLAAVSIGFESGRLGIFQTLASRRKRGPSGVPLSRADLYG
jgi:cyclopropane-fatty-acyl-phospholipid synthase